MRSTLIPVLAAVGLLAAGGFVMGHGADNYNRNTPVQTATGGDGHGGYDYGQNAGYQTATGGDGHGGYDYGQNARQQTAMGGDGHGGGAVG
jgi:hypothetical protein